MFLTTTLQKIQVQLAGAKATLDSPVLIDYVDITPTSLTPGFYPSNTNGVTAVDVLIAPLFNTQRKINGFTLTNIDTAVIVPSLIYNDNGTSYKLCTVTLSIGDTLGYTDAGGWYTQDAYGSRKTTVQLAYSVVIAALGFTPENAALKDASNGYAGLTLFKLNLKNAANTITNFFTNATTGIRTWTMPDISGTVAAFTGALTTSLTRGDGAGGLVSTTVGYADLSASDTLFTAYQGWVAMGLVQTTILVTSDDTTVTLAWAKTGGGNVPICWSTGVTTVTAASIVLTLGTDAAPTLNYVYIPLSTKVLTVSTSDFPATEEYYAVGKYVVESAPTIKNFGLYGKHDYQDEIWASGENGHIQQISYWIRRQPATWDEGVVISQTITASAGLDSVDVATTSGVVLQLHERTFAALNTALPATSVVTITNATPAVVSWATHGLSIGDAISFYTTDTLPSPIVTGIIYYVITAGFGVGAFQISLAKGGAAVNTTTAGAGVHSAHKCTYANTVFVVNSSISAYKPYGDLSRPMLLLSTGVALTNNDRFSTVIWGCVDGAGDIKLFANLASGVYGSDALAIADAQGYANYLIPSAYINSGFLIGKLTYKYNTATGGNYTLVEMKDLRGQFPSVAAGGTTITPNTFTDNLFRIQNVLDVTKQVAWDISGITTATVVTMLPDSVPVTNSAANYAVLTTTKSLINTVASTLTLLSAASYPGRALKVTTTGANAIISASSNVVPITGGAAGTAILAATAGKWAELISDGTNWVIISNN